MLNVEKEASSQKVAEIVSMGLTPVVVILSVAVVAVFSRSAVKAIKKHEKEATDWLILGVSLGFVGSILDNLYWSIPWSLHFLGNPLCTFFQEMGVFVNVVVRQLLGMTAAYCHLRAAEEQGSYFKGRTNSIFLFANVAGVSYAILLINMQ